MAISYFHILFYCSESGHEILATIKEQSNLSVIKPLTEACEHFICILALTVIYELVGCYGEQINKKRVLRASKSHYSFLRNQWYWFCWIELDINVLVSAQDKVIHTTGSHQETFHSLRKRRLCSPLSVFYRTTTEVDWVVSQNISIRKIMSRRSFEGFPVPPTHPSPDESTSTR